MGMQVHEKQRAQIELWLKIASELAIKISKKPEDEITKRDIIKVAQRVEVIGKVLNGEAVIAGWRK